MKYIKDIAVKTFCKEHDRQASSSFLSALDRVVEEILNQAVKIFNGHKRLSGTEIGKIRGNQKNP